MEDGLSYNSTGKKTTKDERMHMSGSEAKGLNVMILKAFCLSMDDILFDAEWLYFDVEIMPF